MSNTEKKQSIFDINSANMTQGDMLILSSDSVIETNMTPGGSPRRRNQNTAEEAQEKRDRLFMFVTLANQRRALELQLQDLTKALQTELAVLEKLQVQHTEITAALKEKLNTLAESRVVLAELQTEMRAVHQKFDVLNEEINLIETEYGTLLEEIDSLAKHSEEQVEKFDKLSPAEQQEWIQSGKAQSDASAVMCLIENEEKRKNLEHQKECLEKILAEKKEVFAATKDEIAKLEKDAATLQSDLTDNEDNQTLCKGRITKIKDKIGEIKDRLHEIDTQLNHVNAPLSCTIPQTEAAHAKDANTKDANTRVNSAHSAFNIAAADGGQQNDPAQNIIIQPQPPEIQASTPAQEVPQAAGGGNTEAKTNVQFKYLTVHDLTPAQTDMIAAEISRFAETIRKVETGEIAAPAHMDILMNDFKTLQDIKTDKALKTNDVTGQIDGASETLSAYLLKKLDITVARGASDVSVAEESQDTTEKEDKENEEDKKKENPENPAMKPDPHLYTLAERKNTLAAIAAGQLLGISKEELALAAEELGITGKYFDMVFDDIRRMPDVKIIEPALLKENFNIAAPTFAFGANRR